MEVNHNSKPSVRDRKKDRLQHNRHPRDTHHKHEFYMCLYAIPTFAAILCYLNGLDGDFVHDDRYAIRDNPDVTGKAPINRLFWSDFWGKPMCDNTSHKSYRPFTVLTFRLDYHLGRGSPWQFHVVNLILHATVTWLFVHVLRHVLHVQDLVAGAAALLFAVHPVHTEAVTGIVGRAELLSCLGILLSLLCYARSLGVHQSGILTEASSRRTSQPVYFWLAMGSCGAAMLCKEHGITGLGLCAVLDVFVFSRTATRRWVCTKKLDPGLCALMKRLAAIVCVAALLMWFRLWMMFGQMPAFRGEDNPASFSPVWLTRVLTFNYLVAFNVWLLMCPRVLSYDWQGGSIPLVTGLDDVRNLATVTLYVIISIAAVKCLRDFLQKVEGEDADDYNNNATGKSKIANSSSQHVLLVGMAMMALPFVPSSNLFFRVGFVVAERVLYIPSLGFCLLVAQGAVTLWQKYKHSRHRHARWCLILSATACLLLLAAKTYTRNHIWKSRETLFWSGIQTLPHNAKMHYNYANMLKDRGEKRQAVFHYKTAISLNPSQPSYHNNLGTVLEKSEEAEACYRRALSLHPRHRGALVNLGNLLINKNDSSGEQLLLDALAIDPHYLDALLSLSQLELRKGRWQKAEVFIKEALKQRPDLPDLYNYYGIIFHKTGQYEEAVASYQRAVSLNNNYAPALTNAAVTLRQLGRNLEAEELLKRAVATTQDVGAMGLLGELYQHAGRTQDAMAVYTQMAHKAPNDTDILLNFVKTLMDKGDYRRAEEILTPMLARAPNKADVLFAMGHVQAGLGHLQEAVSVFQKANRWSGGNVHLTAKIHYELGNMYKDLQLFPNALQSYQSSLSTDPSLTHAHHNLGALHHLLENYDEARYHYEQVLQKEPDNPIVLQNLLKLQRAAHKQFAAKTGA